MKHTTTTFKNLLFVTALGTFNTLPTVSASDEVEDDKNYATPQRTTSIFAAQVLQQTPSQKLSIKISETLTIDKFTHVLSTEEMRSIDVNWEALSNPKMPFDHPDIRSSLVRLKRALTRLLPSKSTDINFMNIWTQLSIIDASISNVHWDRLKDLTPKYFNSLSCEVLDLAPKCDGRQFGAKALVKLPNGEIVKYHIKTHSAGLASENSDAPELVNPAELLVYKVLEGLGMGCECHFFGRDGQNLYIATLDAGVQSSADGETFTPLHFKEYAHFKDAKDPNVQTQLWGDLFQLTEDIQLSEAQHKQAESWLVSDYRSRMFVHEMSKLDLLARIMRLTDFQTNTGNYGFVQGGGGAMKAKALDFRLTSSEPNETKLGEYFFESFLDGNGLYNYISADKVMCYALRHRKQHLRVLEAKSVLSTELKAFETVVTQAIQTVINSLNNTPMTDAERSKTSQELMQYADVITSNFKIFNDKLQKYDFPEADEK